MKVSMDGLRRQLAGSYNSLVRNYTTKNHEGVIENISDLRQLIAGLLACYDPEDTDFNEIDIDLFYIEE